MRNLILGLALSCGLNFAIAQDLPKPSQAGETKQRIGLTDLTVNYSRPNVKGRSIWGELVPYNEMWRLGANGATLFTTTDDVKISGKELKAGTYAVFALPTENEWTIHFNTAVESWGTGDYKKENDVLTFNVKPSVCEMVESMRFTFENVLAQKGDLVLAWEKKSIAFSIEVDVAKKAMENIEKAIAESKEEDKWKVYRTAANYCAEEKSNLDKGLAWINTSVELNGDNWYSYWVMADVKAASNDKKGAVEAAKKAIEKGEAAAKKDGKDFRYKSDLEESIKEWGS